jgi:adenylate cyclase
LAARGHASLTETADSLQMAHLEESQEALRRGFVSMVVLPFTSDGAQGAEQTVADRVTADLIDELSDLLPLRLISAQTSQLYRGKTVDVAALGAQLGVRYVVEGRVSFLGDWMWINLALIDGSSRVRVWSSRFEYPRADWSSARSEITADLARSLSTQVVATEGRRTARQGDPGVEGLLAQGWAAVQRHNAASTTGEAEANFEEVLRRDPDNLAALIGLGAQYVAAVSNLYVAQREPYLSRGEEMLSRAIAQHPEAAAAHYWLGVAQKTRGELDEALLSFDRAIKLKPGFAGAHAQAGHIDAQMGRVEEGLAKIHYAIRLNPNDPAVGRWYMFLGQVELERDHYDAAIEWLSRGVALMPRNARLHASLAAAYALAGNLMDAAKQVGEVKKLLAGRIDQIADQSVAPFNSGSRTGAPRLLDGWHRALSAT